MTKLIFRDFDAENDMIAGSPNAVGGQAEGSSGSYSEDKVSQLLADTRMQALAEGHANGTAEAQASYEAAIVETLTGLQAQMTQLLEQDAIRLAKMERDLVDLVLAVGERVVPDLIKVLSPNRVENRIREGFRLAVGSSGLTVCVSPETNKTIGDKLKKIAATSLTECQTEIDVDPDLRGGEVRLQWDNGLLEYSLDRVCDEILDALRGAVDSSNTSERD